MVVSGSQREKRDKEKEEILSKGVNGQTNDSSSILVLQHHPSQHASKRTSGNYPKVKNWHFRREENKKYRVSSFLSRVQTTEGFFPVLPRATNEKRKEKESLTNSGFFVTLDLSFTSQINFYGDDWSLEKRRKKNLSLFLFTVFRGP